MQCRGVVGERLSASRVHTAVAVVVPSDMRSHERVRHGGRRQIHFCVSASVARQTDGRTDQHRHKQPDISLDLTRLT